MTAPGQMYRTHWQNYRCHRHADESSLIYTHDDVGYINTGGKEQAVHVRVGHSKGPEQTWTPLRIVHPPYQR